MRGFFRSIGRTKRVYLDWAAAAPVSTEARAALHEALPVGGNPSSLHREGQAATALLERARSEIAALCGAKARAVTFTSGATEANALAILGRIQKLHRDGVEYQDMHVLYLPVSHASTRGNMERLAKLGVQVEPLPLVGGALDIAGTTALLRPETVLVSCDAACSETGIRFDTKRLAQVIAEHPVSTCALLHVDASQLPFVEPLEWTRFGADLLVLDAQKVGGVRGIGVLVSNSPGAIEAIVGGGGQEQGIRPGTEPVGLAVAFAAALRAASSGRSTFAARAVNDRASLIQSLQKAVPAISITEGKRQLPHIISLSLPGTDTEYLAALLDARGFAVSTRSACEADLGTESRAVLAYTGDAIRARSTLRISWGPDTVTGDLLSIVPVLHEILPLAPVHTVPSSN